MEGLIKIPPVKLIALNEEACFSIGSAYKNDIFYKEDNHIMPGHGSVFYDGGALIITLCTPEGASLKERTGRVSKPLRISDDEYSLKLSYGDEASIYGLKIMFLLKYVLIYSLNNDFRVAIKEGRNGIASYGRG